MSDPTWDADYAASHRPERAAEVIAELSPPARTYRGVLRSGACATGHVPSDLSVATFVERKHRANWLRLEVRIGDRLAGAIEVNPDTGKRMWWAES